MRGHYHVDQATATLGLGLLVLGGRIATLLRGHLIDMLLRRGLVTARVSVPAVFHLGAAGLLIPGILIATFTPAVWFDAGGMALISAANPPLDAARLDIMLAGLWGRAESTRTVIRSLTQAVAPLAFGGLADLIAGIAPQQSPVGTHPGLVSSSTATGLKFTFLMMVAALAAAGILLARARHTYPVDVATASACLRTSRADLTQPQQRSVQAARRGPQRQRRDNALAAEGSTASAFQTRKVRRGILSAPETQVGVTNTAGRPQRR